MKMMLAWLTVVSDKNWWKRLITKQTLPFIMGRVKPVVSKPLPVVPSVFRDSDPRAKVIKIKIILKFIQILSVSKLEFGIEIGNDEEMATSRFNYLEIILFLHFFECIRTFIRELRAQYINLSSLLAYNLYTPDMINLTLCWQTYIWSQRTHLWHY